MNHTIRMTKLQFEAVKAIKEYIQASGFFSQSFDDKDIINLIFHYYSSITPGEKELLFRQGENYVKTPSLAKNSLPRFMEKLGILDIKGKPESKMMMLDEKTEIEIRSINKSYPGENLTNIIKNVIFGFVVNPRKVTDMMVGYLFSQAFLFISLDYFTGRYNFERAKEDFINIKLPGIEIKPVEFSNFTYVFEEIRKLNSYQKIVDKYNLSEKDTNKIVDDMSSGMLSLTYETKESLPPRLKLLDMLSSKLLAHMLPTLISHKLLSILLIHAGFKRDNMIQSYSSVIDSTVPLIIPDFNPGNLKNSYADVGPIIFNHIDQWENYLKDFKNQN